MAKIRILKIPYNAEGAHLEKVGSGRFKPLLWLGWLACCAQPWLGLAWACLACLALAWSSNNNRPPSAAGGGFAAAVVVAGPGQGKAGMTGPGQTRPRQGTTGKPAKPKQDSGMGMPSNFVTTGGIVKNIKELTIYLLSCSHMSRFQREPCYGFA